MKRLKTAEQIGRDGAAAILEKMSPDIVARLRNEGGLTAVVVNDNHRIRPNGGWQADGATIYHDGKAVATTDGITVTPTENK